MFVSLRRQPNSSSSISPVDLRRRRRESLQKSASMAPVKITGAVVAAAATMVMLSYCFFRFSSDKLDSCSSSSSSKKKKKLSTRNGLVDAIGNTPLIRINSLSDATGSEVFLLYFLNYIYIYLKDISFDSICYYFRFLASASF